MADREMTAVEVIAREFDAGIRIGDQDADAVNLLGTATRAIDALNAAGFDIVKRDEAADRLNALADGDMGDYASSAGILTDEQIERIWKGVQGAMWDRARRAEAVHVGPIATGVNE